MSRARLSSLRVLPVILGLLLASCAPAAAPQPTKPAVAAPTVQPTKPAASPDKAGATSPTPVSAAEAPKYGGVLTSYISGNPPSLDAQQEPTTNTSLIVTPPVQHPCPVRSLDGR